MYTRSELVEKLRQLKAKGWVRNARPFNQGGVGNTVEDYLGIRENNIPVADLGEIELKTKRKNDKSLSTLFHVDPYPRRSPHALYDILLRHFSWPNRNNPREKKLQDDYADYQIHRSWLLHRD
jgi:hypothetical protein